MASLRAFNADQFLAETWQKRPLLIRNALVDWSNPLDPDELAGLAGEAEVESRLVRQPVPGRWEVENGPIDAERFGTLGDCPWTLLVQAVDHHVPQVAALIEPFRFIPDWRIDDVMVSYATDGGGVGPHFDQYDVFLVQGLGRRRWRVGSLCNERARLLPHDSLRLLADFETLDEWVLEPGDILYVPPGFAHDGVALGDDCMTYSIGFRAPSRGDLISAYADHVLDTSSASDRYTDDSLSAGPHPGEITRDALSRLHDMITGPLNDHAAFAAWLGRYVTTPKNQQIEWAPDCRVTISDLLSDETGFIRFVRNSASQFSFVRHGDGALTLFVDGEDYACRGHAAEIAERICAGTQFTLTRKLVSQSDLGELLVDLVNRGCIALETPD